MMQSQNQKPQDSQILRSLRVEQLNFSQEKMAAGLSEAFRKATGMSHCIQQPDVCRLENGSASIDIFKLLAYSYLCKVDIAYLLRKEYRGLLRNSTSEMQFQTFASDAEAEQHLTALEQNKRLLISPVFPSSFFRIDQNSQRYQQLASPDYEANELYTIDSFISFLFSPVVQYTLDEKKSILEQYLHYFRNNNFRQLNFFPRSVLPENSLLTSIELLPEQKMLLIPAPVTHYGQGDAFIEVRDQNIYNDITEFYRSLHMFENSMIYLRIGLAALDRMRDGSPAREAITSFAIEIAKTRDLNATEAIKCFSPEIQAMINE